MAVPIGDPIIFFGDLGVNGLAQSLIGRAVQRFTRPAAPDASTADLNRRLLGYPRNHDYHLRGDKIVPSRMLRDRADSIARALPLKLGRFLDIGSCKGYFVLQASITDGCPLAVGIDVYEPFISVSNDVRDRLRRTNAAFHRASLDELASDPQRFGGPFNTVQLVSTYHYLFWGSELEPKSFGTHEAILAMLARVCTRFLVFANPLDIDDSPKFIQERARAQGDCGYSRAAFLRAADAFFDVIPIGYMDKQRKRPLLLLVNRSNAAPHE